MSRTYEIACLNCRNTLWVGQGWPETSGVYLYKNSNAILHLEEFLFRHEGHNLIFGDSEILDLDDFVSVDEEQESVRPIDVPRGNREGKITRIKV